MKVHRYNRSGPACYGQCPEGTECVPSYDPYGSSVYECRDTEEDLLWYGRSGRDWAHTVDPRNCVYGLGCKAGAMSRRARQMAFYPTTKRRAEFETVTQQVTKHHRSPWGSNDPISARRGKRIRTTGKNPDVEVLSYPRTVTYELVEE